jgi:hypothetical protein
VNASLRRLQSHSGQRPPATAARPRLEVARPGVAPGESATTTTDERSRRRRRRITLPGLFGLVTIALLWFGYAFPTEQYLNPQAGVGYLLGILGGSSMLLLLVYPLRKRMRWLAFIGTTRRWFQAHMALGVVGPLLVLYHSNFSLGAVNSNVALFCMLVVSGSGLFGRYFYAHIHHGLHGRKATLVELKEHAERLRWVTTTVEFLPDLVARIDEEEQRIVGASRRVPLLARPIAGALAGALSRHRLRRYVSRVIRESTPTRESARTRRTHLQDTARRYVDDRLGAIRRVVEFEAYERLFSLWHTLHLPLFLMLLIAGVVHVVAVHVY